MTSWTRRAVMIAFGAVLILLAVVQAAWPADPKPGPALTIQRAPGPIVVDGDLSDAGWNGVPEITTWYETNPGDNVEPGVANVGYLAYDDHYFYAGFRFEDPDPRAIRAPLGDHDAVPSSTDYGGVIVDSRNDGKSAQMFLSNPRGVRYDAISNDDSGEDNAPDYFWDAAGRITETGWTLEIRIPFSSLRYERADQPTWRIMLYRNHPRDRRYQYFSTPLPRDVNCFICNSTPLTGLDELPAGSHLVVAPFGTTQQTRLPTAGLGSSLDDPAFDSELGVDVKWNPLATLAIDATVNPDFSQVESDVAQIAANERFALFFDEKRPFFLEGVDLLQTPFRAVYTRTVTAPTAGLRATGKLGNTAYTVLATRDEGGGLVVLPGPQGSDVAPQDFESDVGVLRVRQDIGRSSVGVLATAREVDGGGHNRVFGSDFQWRARPSDSFAGQVLWSESKTPNRTDLASEWDGSTMSDVAAKAYWSHGGEHHDWYLQGEDVGEEFRADDGFIPQVGYREGYFETGYTARPKNFLSRIRVFTVNYADWSHDGDLLNGRYSVGTGMDGRWNSFFRVELNRDEIRVGNDLLLRFRPRVYVESSPGRVLNYVWLDSHFGDEIDFANGREGSGVSLSGGFTLRPNDHLAVQVDASRRWLDVTTPTADSDRLFTARVERVRATWSFNARSFVRLIGQHVETKRDAGLYGFAVAPKSESANLSGLFAYKLNWQTVLYLGYGDNREFAEATDSLEESGRQAFAKVSYAWQR